GRTQWIADINHTFGSVALKPWDGDYGVIGISVQAVDYGELHETIRSTNTQGYIETGTFHPTGLAIGLGYARAVNEQFSFGLQVKYVKQYLGNAIVSYTGGAASRKDNTSDVPAVDFGIFYHTPFQGLDFGMTVRNFSREARFEDDDFQLPLTFKIGIAVHFMDILSMEDKDHAFALYVDAEHPRDFPEQVRFGGEYTLAEMFSFRAGLVRGVPEIEEGVSFGFGHQKQYDKLWFGLDYAYTPFGVFGGVHRFSFQFSL
ncbi:MAG: PorV/PorQ family protein, partial [Bacteroidota bacterium]